MKCPKCGTQIKRFDLAPNCKKCGVHILYYTQEEDLKRDAKKTELEFASARLLVAKLKAAFIGGRVQILRAVFLLLSAASFLLPSFNISLSFPWWEYEISVGAIGVYNLISDSFYSLFGVLTDIQFAKLLFIFTLCSFITLVLSVLCVLGCAAAWLLSFINMKKTALTGVIFSSLAIASELARTVLSFLAVNTAGQYEFISVKPLFGTILSIVILGALLAVNIILMFTEPEIRIKEADRQRLEIKKQLKEGVITLDSLPLPIVEESEEEKSDKPKKRGKKK